MSETKEKLLAALRQGMSRKTAMTLAGVGVPEQAIFDWGPEMDLAEAQFEADWVAKCSEQAVTYGESIDFLARQRSRWRSPDTKLRQKDLELRREEAARQLTAAPPSQQTWTLAEIERELALRRGLVQVIEAKPIKDAVDMKLLSEYKGGDDDP